jgi:ribA/ribD-fused uncharacterized protein
METNDKILFYSHNKTYGYMSNFYPSKFVDDNVEYNCSEQYFMKKKQELFDPTNITLANKILTNNIPSEIKKFGRQVKNYDEDIWNNMRYDIMKNGLRLKFMQNLDIKQKLINTNPKKLFEASPYDKIWGTGYNAVDTLHFIEQNEEHKLGTNLLGKALEEIRNELN